MMTNPQSSSESLVAVSDEPHHKLVIENDAVRAYAVEIAPGERTLCHQHMHDYLLYVIGEAHVCSIDAEGSASELDYNDADCEFLEAGMKHVVENRGRNNFRNIVVELLPGAEQARRAGLPFSSVAGVQARELYSGEKVCAQLFELRPGAQTQVSGPAVVVPANGVAFELITPEGGVAKLQNFNDLGYVEMNSTGLLRCEGTGSVRALVISVGLA